MPYTFTVPKTGQGDEPVIIKLNANWQVQWVKSMYYNITDISNVAANNPVNYFTGLSFDENDNMYLTGMMDLYYGGIPLYIYFDQEHRLAMDNESYLTSNGYIVKYDTEGNAQWCNQIYSNGTSCMKYFYGSVISDNSVFVLGDAYGAAMFYNGNEYVEITSPISSQQDKAFVVKFDKETGLYLNHDIIPNVISTKILGGINIPNNPAIIGNYVVAKSTVSTITTGINSKNHLIARFRTDNCQFVDVLDTVYFTNTQLNQTTGSVSGNNNGDMFTYFVASSTMNLGNLPPTYIGSENSAVFALKNDPRLRVDVTNITLTPSAITLKVDDIEQLIATVLPTNAGNKNVSWSSSAPAIASVDNGVVTALSEGAATITVATEEGNHTAHCAVTVTPKSGIDKVWANGIKIYPNPASSVLSIENGDLKINSVEITDFIGKTVIITGKNTNKIDVFALSQGIYFVKIYTDKGAVVKSFVKE